MRLLQLRGTLPRGGAFDQKRARAYCRGNYASQRCASTGCTLCALVRCATQGAAFLGLSFRTAAGWMAGAFFPRKTGSA
jgi:hypothetical protein